jgi:hypothetical protein
MVVWFNQIAVFNLYIFFCFGSVYPERFWSKLLGGLKAHIASVRLDFSGGKRLDNHWQCVLRLNIYFFLIYLFFFIDRFIVLSFGMGLESKLKVVQRERK